MEPTKKEEYTNYGSELDKKTYDLVKELHGMNTVENTQKSDNGGNNMTNGVNNNDAATIGLLGAVSGGGYGGYGGYGNRGSTQVGNKILFDQNHENGRDIHENGRDILKGQCSIEKTVADANVNNNNAAALRGVTDELNATARQTDLTDRFREVATSTATNRVTDLMNNNEQHAGLTSQFAITETKLDLLCQRLNTMEVNAMGREIATMHTASILAGQKSTMLESQLKDYCCPKPSAIMQTVGCPPVNPCGGGNGGNSITINEVVQIVNTMMASSGGGHGRGN